MLPGLPIPQASTAALPRSSISWSERVYLLAFLGLIAVEVLYLFVTTKDAPFLSHLDDIVILVAVLPLAVRGLVRMWQRPYGRYVIGLVVAWQALGLASSTNLLVPWTACVLQFLLNLRVLFYIAIGFGVDWSPIGDDRLRTTLRALTLVSIPLIVLQWTNPSLHGALFPGAMTDTYLALGFLPRATGPFFHPSMFGFVAGACLVFFFADFLSRRSILGLAFTIMAGVCLLASQQRQEIAAAGLVCLTVPLLVMTRKMLVSSLLTVVGWTAAFSLCVVLYSEQIGELYVTYQSGKMGSRPVPRSFFWVFGPRIASHYFPLGAGLGSFGGQAASAYDSPLYRSNGLARVWWYQERRFLTDTFWPMPIAESGWIGAGTLLLLHLFLAWLLLRSRMQAREWKDHLFLQALSLFTYGFLASATTAVQTNSLKSFFLFGTLGLYLRDHPGYDPVTLRETVPPKALPSGPQPGSLAGPPMVLHLPGASARSLPSSPADS